MGVKENGNELDEVFSGYKKFWDEHNKNQKKVKDVKNEPEDLDNESEDSGEEIKDTEVNSEESYQSSELSRQDSDEDGEKNSKFINDLFDEAEEKITSKMESKLTELKPKLLETNGKNKKSVSKKRNNFNDARNLGFEKKARLGDVDEALMEGDDKANENFNAPSWKLLKEVKRKKKEKESFMKGSGDINPNSFLSVQSKHLLSAIPISQVFDDIDDEVDVKQLSRSNKMSLAEAFEDDDIMNDFKQEVEDEFKKKLAPEDTALPGWGNWGGCGVKAKKPRPETKILEVKKKDRIIISSALNEKLQKHLISSVPFPFKSVQDFEASMRLPIGKDFIPETAHRKLTLPSIVTKAGAVIEPMTEETLVQQKGGLKNKFLKKGKKVKKLKK